MDIDAILRQDEVNLAYVHGSTVLYEATIVCAQAEMASLKVGDEIS